MAKLTTLQLVNKIIHEKMGLSDPVTTIEGTADTVEFIALRVLWAINEMQRKLVDAYDWPILKEQDYVTFVADDDLYSLIPNTAGVLINRVTMVYYDRALTVSGSYPKITLVSDDQWHDHNVSNEIDGMPYIAREFGLDGSGNKQLQVYGAPNSSTAGTKLYYEFIKEVDDLDEDADTSIFNDVLLIEGTEMIMKGTKGLVTQQDVLEFIELRAGKVMQVNRNRKRTLPYRDIG